MRIHRTRLLTAVSAAAITSLAVAGPAAAGGDGAHDRHHGGHDTSHGRDHEDDHEDRQDRIHVRPGQSIQEAVDAARPGDTVVLHPGEYEQNVTITTDDVALVGHHAVLLPAGAEQTPCDTVGEEAPEEDAGATGAEGPSGDQGTGGDQSSTAEAGTGDGPTADTGSTGAQGSTGGTGTTAADEPAEPEAPRVSGICLVGEVTFPEAPTDPIQVPDPVTGVTVSGVTVEGASGDGLIALGTEDLEVERSSFADNGGYGAASFVGTRVTFAGNEATGNAEAGFYIGDSADADADVRGNHAAGNELGFFFRNASDGQARHNVAEGNCLGVLVLAGAPGPATGWDLHHNEVTANDEVCPGNPEDGVPPLSGAGIALVGARDFRVAHNRVTDNASSAPSAIEGGIVGVSSSTVPGLAPFDPSGEIVHNEATGNEPADIVHDGSGDVDIAGNECDRSSPDGLCD